MDKITTLLQQAPKTRFFGKDKKTGEHIYCGWYWGFGYLGNESCHYHLSSYQNGRNINMYDALKEDYQLAPQIEKNLWLFCELAITAYSLKETAEVLGRGGSHMSVNPLCDLIKNPEEVKRINELLLPSIFEEIEKIFNKESL